MRELYNPMFYKDYVVIHMQNYSVIVKINVLNLSLYATCKLKML